MNLDVVFSEPTETIMAVEFSESTQGEGVDFGELQIMNTASIPRIGWVTLLADAWEGAEGRYSQIVTVKGATEYSQIDLTPDAEQLAIFHAKDLAFVAENEDGVITVYAIGQKPTNDYTMQVTITEVSV